MNDYLRVTEAHSQFTLILRFSSCNTFFFDTRCTINKFFSFFKHQDQWFHVQLDNADLLVACRCQFDIEWIFTAPASAAPAAATAGQEQLQLHQIFFDSFQGRSIQGLALISAIMFSLFNASYFLQISLIFMFLFFVLGYAA